MKVWAVLETDDYCTVEVFATEELAEEYVRLWHLRHGSWDGRPSHVVSEVEVLAALPERLIS